jgi:hypothetical protein
MNGPHIARINNTTINGHPAAEVVWDNGYQTDRIAIITGSAGYWQYEITAMANRFDGPRVGYQRSRKTRRQAAQLVADGFGIPLA